ncbi:MAG: PQQ-binding-like beta-propeller repeat protein [bacterium]|nr:PQQ-binding-like beta-propeller repeat protein [bacterium]
MPGTAEYRELRAQNRAGTAELQLNRGWTAARAGLPEHGRYRLVSMAFLDSAGAGSPRGGTAYAAIDSQTPASDKKSVGPEDGVYRLAGDRWTHIAPPVNRYAVRPLLAAAGRIYTVDHSGTRLYRLKIDAKPADAWEDLGALTIFAQAKPARQSQQNKKSKHAPACRKFELARAVGDRIYCAGGKHEGRLFVYDIKARRWSEPIPQALPKAPQGIGGMAVTARGEVFVSLRGQRADLLPANKNGALERTAIYRANLKQSRWEAVPFGVPAKDPEYRRYLSEYVNATGNKAGPAKILGSDGESVYASTQQGLFVYAPAGSGGEGTPRDFARHPWQARLYMWYKAGGFVAGGQFFSTYAKGQVKRWASADRYQSIPDPLNGSCAQRSRIFSPDGRTLYAGAYITQSSRDKKGRIKCDKTSIVHNAGLVRYTVGESTPTSSLNLDPRVAGFAPRGDSIAGTAINARGDTFYITTTTATDKDPAASHMLRLPKDSGRLTELYDIGERIGLPGVVRDFAGSYKNERFAIGGDSGVAAIDPESGKALWTQATKANASPENNAQSGAKISRVAIASDGSVAALSGKTVIVYSPQGRELARTTLSRSYVTDVEISAESGLVYIVGFDNKRNRNPVQVAYLELRDLKTLKFKSKVWGYKASAVANDMADTRLYRVLIGRDGNLYVSGESAGGNTIFRWNGRDLKTSKLIKSDLYNDPWALKSAHILYYARLDPRTGSVLRGQFAIPRLVSKKNLGNTFRAKNGGLAVDEAGNVYLAGSSACCIPNGRLLKVAGERTGAKYAGGAALLIVSADFRERRLWTTFGGGKLSAVSARIKDGEAHFAVAGRPHAEAAKRKRHALVTTNNAGNAGDPESSSAYFAAARLD